MSGEKVSDATLEGWIARFRAPLRAGEQCVILSDDVDELAAALDELLRLRIRDRIHTNQVNDRAQDLLDARAERNDAVARLDVERARAAAAEYELRNRKDGQSPEEFIAENATRVAEVDETRRGQLLAGLAKMSDGLVEVRRALTWVQRGPATPDQREAGKKWLESLP